MDKNNKSENSDGAGCIFCKIVQDELPCYRVYEDKYFLAFLDIHPLAPGHVQIIPKTHHRFVWDLPAESDTPFNIGEYFKVAQKIALAQKKAFRTDMVRSQIYGEEVHHAHIWVWPDAPGDAKDFENNLKKLIKEL